MGGYVGVVFTVGGIYIGNGIGCGEGNVVIEVGAHGVSSENAMCVIY